MILSFFQIVEKVPWYTEKNINGITLGSLLILIVLRTIQYNMAKMRVSVRFIFIT